MAKPKKTRRNNLPRKSKLRGKLARLKLRQDQMGRDDSPHGLHYIRPGSLRK